MNSAYTPPSCSFYDHLEVKSMRRTASELVYLDEHGQEVTAEATIADIFSKDGADWARLTSGMVLRLDRILSIDGVSSRSSC